MHLSRAIVLTSIVSGLCSAPAFAMKQADYAVLRSRTAITQVDFTLPLYPQFHRLATHNVAMVGTVDRVLQHAPITVFALKTESGQTVFLADTVDDTDIVEGKKLHVLARIPPEGASLHCLGLTPVLDDAPAPITVTAPTIIASTPPSVASVPSLPEPAPAGEPVQPPVLPAPASSEPAPPVVAPAPMAPPPAPATTEPELAPAKPAHASPMPPSIPSDTNHAGVNTAAIKPAQPAIPAATTPQAAGASAHHVTVKPAPTATRPPVTPAVAAQPGKHQPVTRHLVSPQAHHSDTPSVAWYVNKVQQFARSIPADTVKTIVTTVLGKSKSYGVDPRLVLALIAQESRFNPNAVSPVGARGLGQLMPDTARLLGVTDPFDIAQNIDATIRYLTRQIRTFHGNIAYALAAYNAGPGNVNRYGGIPPFRETQNYVQTINSHYQGMVEQSL